MAKLTAVTSTFNRATSLARTLASVRFADEIIVVNNSSTDRTEEVAKRFTNKIFTRPNNLMLNVNKNYGFTKATGDWILCLDDDEEVTTELAKEIREKALGSELRAQGSQVVGYWIPRKNIIFGKWIQHSLWWPDPQLRLFRRGRGRFPEKHAHEYLVVDGSTDKLAQAMIHYNYDSVDHYLTKMQTIYTDSEVAKLTASGYQLTWADALRFPISDFLKTYFAQEGWKDGLHGLVLSLLQSFYSLVVFAKVWEKEKFRQIEVPYRDAQREFLQASHELQYWMFSTAFKEEKNPLRRLWWKLARRYHGSRTKA